MLYIPHPQAATQGKCCLLMRQKSLDTDSQQFNLIIICNLPKWAQERAWM